MSIKTLGEDWIDEAEAASLFKIKERTIKNKAARGEIPGTLIGNQWFFNINTLREFIKQQFEKKSQEKALRGTEKCQSVSVARKVSGGTTSRLTKLDTAAQLKLLKKPWRNATKVN